ncbi:toxin-antitoxin system TumE family protein [Caballeronia sp. LjRoot31]|uniref:toxin-antitoxin system TumE family protein n=1 Tax=Caballeronia sp. LjRoot31 TaxID=3342324 RepID=UPI003ECF337B
MSMKQLMQLCAEHQLDGRQTDTCCRAVAVNALAPDSPVCAFAMESPQELLWLMKTSDSAHMYVESGVCHFNAVYFMTDGFPAIRIYFMKTPYLPEIAKIGVFLERNGFKLPLLCASELAQMVDERGYAARYQAWHERWRARSKQFKGLVDGRVQNTVVEQGIWLATDGCLICGADYGYLSTATLVGATGMMIGLRLCEEHIDEARDHATLVDYVAVKMSLPTPFLSGMRLIKNPGDMLEMSCAALREELLCDIERIDNTITAIRPSGFRVILRQDALDNYAYVIQNPNGKMISRIDSADHHKVDYGPAHVHRDLSKSKKNQVKPSFTYGFAVMDIKGIRSLLQQAESLWVPQ